MALFPFWKLVESHLGIPEILEQGWALRVEFLFYGVVALGLLVTTQLRIGLAPVLATAGTVLLVAVTVVPNHAAGSALENAPYFVLGAALFWLEDGKRRRWGAALIGLCAAVLIVAEMVARPATFGLGHFFRDGRGELLLLAGLTTVFVVLAHIRIESCSLIRMDRVLGDLTYPLYLLHWAVLIAVKTWMPHASLLSTVVAFGLSCALSCFVLAAVERPISALRAHLRQPHRSLFRMGKIAALPS